MSVNYILYQLTLKENFLHCAIIDTKQFLEYKKYLKYIKSIEFGTRIGKVYDYDEFYEKIDDIEYESK